MPRLEPVSSVDESLSRLASAISRTDSPEEAIRSFGSTFGASLPGLRVWTLRREAGSSGPPATWIPSAEPPPFPVEVLSQPGSVAMAAISRAEAIRFPDETNEDRPPEASYLKRRGGAWIFLPVPSTSPAGALVLFHADAGLLEGSLAAIHAAVRLIQPHLALLVARREVEKRIEERTAELALFYETSRALAFAKSETDIATLLGHTLGPALGLEMLGLLVLKPGRAELFVEMIGETNPSVLRGFRRTVAGKAAEALGRPIPPVRVRVNRPARLTSERTRKGAELHVPLIVHESHLGLLSIRSSGPSIDELRARLFYTVASQAALTLERVRTTQEASLLTVRAVLNSMREGVVLVNRNLGVVMANPAGESLAAALLGTPLPSRLRRLGNVDLAPVIESLAVGEEAPSPLEIVSQETDRVFHITVSPAMGLRGLFEGAILVLSDVTKQTRIQEQLMQSEKLSSLGEMISGVAHELNNPLASIMGYAQLLEQSGVPKETQRKVGAINSEASRCHRIVQNLLRFARKQAPERRPVDLNSVVGSVVQLLGYQLQSDNIALDVDLDREMRSIVGDFHALAQVFVNIVNNAHHAMKEKGGRGVLRIATRCDGLTCRVEVSDTGPGIRPHHLKKIFDPFFSTKEVGKGTGLGLSLAYGTVKDHGGQISARSRPEQGTSFIVELPAVATLEEAPAAAKAVAVRGELVQGGKRILVVEDEASLSEMICEALSAEGHQVDRAGDGVTASKKVKEGSYDLIISDLKMPNMGGRELYDAVHRMDPDLARRIIFSTGDSVSADTQAFFRQIGNPYLTKPFNLRDLYNAVNTALRES
jgi:two-component system NtrC family sensor kinase